MVRGGHCRLTPEAVTSARLPVRTNSNHVDGSRGVTALGRRRARSISSSDRLAALAGSPRRARYGRFCPALRRCANDPRGAVTPALAQDFHRAEAAAAAARNTPIKSRRTSLTAIGRHHRRKSATRRPNQGESARSRQGQSTTRAKNATLLQLLTENQGPPAASDRALDAYANAHLICRQTVSATLALVGRVRICVMLRSRSTACWRSRQPRAPRLLCRTRPEVVP
jgi:hypothetical protein